MQQLNNLNEIEAECDRTVRGMLDGSMTRDDGLFTTAAALQKIVNEFKQFVTYVLPIIHQIHQAMIAAQAQMAAAQAKGQELPATQASPQGQASQAPPQAGALPANAVPSDAGATADVQVVAGTPGGGR